MSDNLSVTPDLTVADLLDRYPQVAPVFLHHRMACVGCDMAAFETITDAADHYDLQLTLFLVELVQAATAR